MSFIKLILYGLIFYFVFKLIKNVVKYLTGNIGSRPNFGSTTPNTENKYKDVEEAEFTEIKSDSDSKKE